FPFSPFPGRCSDIDDHPPSETPYGVDFKSQSATMSASLHSCSHTNGFISCVEACAPAEQSGGPAGEMSSSDSDRCTQPGNSSSIESVPDIEKKYVHYVYDAIAPHFSSTRYAKWPKVAEFLNSLQPGSVVLDTGCGNGKYLAFNPQCFFLGCDISASLIKICADKGHEVMVADAVNLPYRDGFGDAAISIAVLHHLSTENRRRKAIAELARAVRKGGLILITVWAVEQEDNSLLKKWTPLTCKYDEEWVEPNCDDTRSSLAVTLECIPETDENNNDDHDCNKAMHLGDKSSSVASEERKHVPKTMPSKTLSHQEYFVPWHLPYHRAEIAGPSASAIACGLATKDDKKGAVVYNRYYHVFAEGEIERLASGIKNVKVRERFYDKSNWCIVLEKI
ncbi:Alkylated DNA repair alkB-like protein 8, partial [Nymphaea thermarum]